MKAIVNGVVYTSAEVIAPGVVLIEEGTITAVGSVDATPVPPEAERIEAGGMSVVPGLIDLHIHGLMGHDAMGTGLAQVIRDLPTFGVTAFLATTLTLPRDEMISGLEAMAMVLDTPPPGAQCLGIHLEGPFLSSNWPGMATSDWFEPLTWETFQTFQPRPRRRVGAAQGPPGPRLRRGRRTVGRGIAASPDHRRREGGVPALRGAIFPVGYLSLARRNRSPGQMHVCATCGIGIDNGSSV